MKPGNTISVNVINYRDVFMTLMARGFINADPSQSMKTLCYIWFKPVVGCFNTVAYRPPVDARELTDNCLGRGECQKSCFVIKIFCES